jgi:hypothetical protein
MQNTGELEKKTKIKIIDYSDENGFRFGFICDHCGFEWLSECIPFKLNGYPENLDEKDRELLWKDEKKRNLEMVISEAVIEFNKCPECGAWVCDNCFFVDAGELTDFCKTCVEEFLH